MWTSLRPREIKRKVELEGAKAASRLLVESLQKGEVNHADFPTWGELWNILVHDKSDDKKILGPTIVGMKNQLQGNQVLAEEAGSYTASDAFTTVVSQLIFNQLTTIYNAADLTVAKLFKRIPSTFINGEYFAGISNLAQIMSPTPFGKELPHVEPTEDKSKAPSQQRFGAIIDLTFDMLTGDRTGETMYMAELMMIAGAVAREYNACQVLADTGANRARYNWKDTVYATYESSATPGDWINLKTSNELKSVANLNSANILLKNILDPFTGLPTMLPPGPMKLIVTPEKEFQARIIKQAIQYRDQPTSTSTTVSITDGFPPADFDVVESKYLRSVLNNASAALDTWFYGHPHAFSRQESMDVTTSQALPGSYSAWSRGLAASFKWENVYAHFAFNPRYMTKNTTA